MLEPLEVDSVLPADPGASSNARSTLAKAVPGHLVRLEGLVLRVRKTNKLHEDHLPSENILQRAGGRRRPPPGLAGATAVPEASVAADSPAGPAVANA